MPSRGVRDQSPPRHPASKANRTTDPAAALHTSAHRGGLRNEHLGWLGLLLVTLLKTLAIPLIFFAILDALVRTRLPLRKGAKLPYLRAQCCHHAGGVFETSSSPLP